MDKHLIKDIDYFHDQLPSKETTYFTHMPADMTTVYYGYDQYGNLLYKDDDNHRSEYDYYYNKIANYFLEEERHKIKTIADGAVWQTTKYSLTSGDRNIGQEIHRVYTGALSAVQTNTGPTSIT